MIKLKLHMCSWPYLRTKCHYNFIMIMEHCTQSAMKTLLLICSDTRNLHCTTLQDESLCADHLSRKKVFICIHSGGVNIYYFITFFRAKCRNFDVAMKISSRCRNAKNKFMTALSVCATNTSGSLEFYLHCVVPINFKFVGNIMFLSSISYRFTQCHILYLPH